MAAEGGGGVASATPPTTRALVGIVVEEEEEEEAVMEAEVEEVPDEISSKLMAKLNLTFADIKVYGLLWDVVDPSTSGYVVAKDAVMFFKKSGLTVGMLRAIWEESDKEPPLGACSVRASVFCVSTCNPPFGVLYHFYRPFVYSVCI